METQGPNSPTAPLRVVGERAEITLTSVHNRNALTPELLAATLASLDAAEQSEARVIVLAAAGPAFCSGMDLRETDPARLRHALGLLVELLTRLAASRLPVIARVHGAARAGGLGLLAVADFSVSVDTVTFAFSEARLGLAPAIVSAPLKHRIASRHLARLFLTSEEIGAVEAATVGLVTEVATKDSLDAAVRRLVEVLAGSDPQGMRETKAVANAAIVDSLTRDGTDLIETSLRLFTSPVARSAIEAARSR